MCISVEEAKRLAAQFNGLPYAPGTRYSNSETYDQATGEVVHGWQVFEQIRPDGTRTGRRSFVSNEGQLCSVEIAKAMRESALYNAAPELLTALKMFVWPYQEGNQHTDTERQEIARAAIIKADGVQV